MIEEVVIDAKGKISPQQSNPFFRCRFDKCIAAGMNRETVRNDRNRRKKQANDENDSRVQEHKKLNELSDKLRKAYDSAWNSGCSPQTLDEVLQLIMNFIDQIPILNELSLDERRSIAHQRYLPLMVKEKRLIMQFIEKYIYQPKDLIYSNFFSFFALST